MILRRLVCARLLFLWITIGQASALADGCPQNGDWINTDRPTQTNSSSVVPEGSVQAESGVNWSVGQGSTVLDGPEMRLRLGVARCLEVLFDVPNYSYSLNGPAGSGFSDSVLSIKYQVAAVPDPFQLSTTAGLGFPTGGKEVAGHGWNPYFQLPWQAALTQQWSVNGMFSLTWYTSHSSQNPTFEPTIGLQRGFEGEKGTVMVEYAGIYDHRQPSQILDGGGQWRPTMGQQVDFQAGFGLNRSSPEYFFGLG